MVNAIYMELIKKDLNDALSTKDLNLSQVHYIMRQSIEKILLLQNDTYEKTIEKYWEKNQEIEKEISEQQKKINELTEQLGQNDKKMYDAIQKL